MSTRAPNPHSVKALALDLDGTILAPGAVLSERAVRAVNRCMRRGIRIIIATGRAAESAEPFRAALGAGGPMIFYNGTLIADMPGGEILKTTLLDAKAAEFCVDLSREIGAHFQIFFPRAADGWRMTLMAERETPELDMYYKHTGIRAEIADLKEVLRGPGQKGCFKCMFLAEPDVLAVLRQRLDGHFGGSVYIAQTLRTFLEVLDAKVSKGAGLSIVMERLSLKREEVIAFGDEENDLPMFAAAGFSAAPSNAKDTVKERADLVLGSNAEDGVAAFLEEFFG